MPVVTAVNSGVVEIIVSDNSGNYFDNRCYDDGISMIVKFAVCLTRCKPKEDTEKSNACP